MAHRRTGLDKTGLNRFELRVRLLDAVFNLEIAANEFGYRHKRAIGRTQMTRILTAVVTVMVVVLLGFLYALMPPTGSEPDGHDVMLQVLQQVKERTANDNPYLGDADLRAADQQLAATSDPVLTVQLLWQKGNAELRLGKTRDAIRSFENFQTQLAALNERISGDVMSQYSREVTLKLAVCWLRVAETENCVDCRNGESCILPIQGEGIHDKTDGSSKAIQYLLQLLQLEPDHLTARWLLNIAHMTLGNWPADVQPEFLIPPERFQSSAPFPRFPNVAAELGLDVFSLAGGVVCDDFDNDGRLDVIVSDWDPAAALRYFRNNSDGSFTERSTEAGFAGMLGGLNMKQADYDNDGDLDLLVLRGGWMGPASTHPNSLLANDGRGTFRDVTIDAGLASYQAPAQTAEWADYDNDGDLDLYVGNEQVPCQLFQNDGRGQFQDVARLAGALNGGFTKGVSWGDYDSDRYPDLYVSNLQSDNRLYHNNRDGTFTDVAARLHVDKPVASFPVWWWDFNNDGNLDLYVSAYDLDDGIESFAADFLEVAHDTEVDHMYRGDGKGGFTDVAAELNMDRVTLPMGSNFGDLNADGFPDYYLGTGYQDYEALMPNLMFLNEGGRRFTDVSMGGGFSHLQKGHGVSFADYDQDGDLDVFIVMGGAFAGDGFRNAAFQNPGFQNNSIAIDVRGSKSNRSGIGVRLKLVVEEGGQERTIYDRVNSGGSFGANPLRRTIGVGTADTIKTLEAYWPTTDTTQQFRDIPVGLHLEITEDDRDYKIITPATSR